MTSTTFGYEKCLYKWGAVKERRFHALFTWGLCPEWVVEKIGNWIRIIPVAIAMLLECA
ncbi:MAG: hypothetical protein ACPL5I_17025 [Thermodesulfobacteriota bacterium]